MSIAVITTVIVTAWLLFCWHAARSAANDCNRRARERRLSGEKPAPTSWEGSAEQQMHHIQTGMGQSQPPY